MQLENARAVPGPPFSYTRRTASVQQSSIIIQHGENDEWRGELASTTQNYYLHLMERVRSSSIPHARNLCAPHLPLQLENAVHECFGSWRAWETNTVSSSLNRDWPNTYNPAHRCPLGRFDRSPEQLSSCNDSTRHHLHSYPC